MSPQASGNHENSLVSTVWESDLTRRHLIKRAIALGASAPVLAAGLSVAPLAYPRSASASALSNTLVLAVQVSVATFDPAAATDSVVDTPSINLYNALVQHKLGTSDIEPDLALSWQASSDGKAYTFKLRQGVKFHDGTVLTAKDVVYTFERILAQKRGVYQNVSAVTSAEAPDDSTVIVHLSAPFPGLVQALTRVYIVNSALVKKNAQNGDYGEAWFNNNDAGSGPYKLTSFEPEQQFTVDKFPDYWKGWEGAHVDSAIFRVLKSDADRQLALQNGDVDWAFIGAVDTWNALKSKPDVQTFTDPTLNQFYFAFNQEDVHLQDLNVRKALSLVYDYKGDVEQARGGQAAVARGPLPPAIPFFDQTMQPSETNIDLAKQLLAKSKWPKGGFSLEMIYQGTDAQETTAVEIMQAGAAKLNIQITPVAMEWPAKVNAYSAPSTTKPIATIWIYPAYPDPYQFFFPLLDSSNIGNGGVNFSYYKNPAVDQLIAQASQELDEKKRADLWAQLQQTFVEDVPYASVVVGYALSAARQWVKGYKWSPTHSFTQDVYSMSLVGKP